MILFAGSFAAMKSAVLAFDPWLVVLARMLLALVAFAILRRRMPPLPSIREHLPLLLVMGLSEPCLYFLFEAQALTLTTASQAGVITALLPVMVACAAGLFLGERTTARGWLGLVLGVAGAAWLGLIAPQDLYSPNPVLGNLLELCAMACGTVYTLTARRLARHFPPLFLTAFQVASGTAFFAPSLFFVPWPKEFPEHALAAVAYLGLGVSVGAYGLYNFCLSRLPASKVARAVNLIPAFTLLLGWLLMGENLHGWQWAAILMVLAGARLTGHSP